MKIGIYPMVADILHTGHVLALQEARRNCDYLIVALHCNPNYKTPIQTIFERYIQLRAVKFVDEIIPYSNSEDAKTMLMSLDYDIYFLGEDYLNKDWENKKYVLNRGKEIYYLSRKHEMSSSSIKERIKNEKIC